MFRLITLTVVYFTAVALVMLGAILCVKLIYTGQYEAIICATLVLDWVIVTGGYLLWLKRKEVI